MLVTSDIFAEYKVNKQLSNGLNQQQQKYQTKTTKNQQKVKLLHVLYIFCYISLCTRRHEYINRVIYCNGLEEEITDPLLITGAYSVMDYCGFMHVIFSVLM